MYSFLHELLSDKKGREIFELFGPWHFFYILLTLVVTVVVVLQGRGEGAGRFSDLAFGLYILDLFLMPLAYGEIDVEKLPFHACTAMCVMGFLSRRAARLERYRSSIAMLGFVSNLVYLIYPAGVMWHGVHPLSYRVIQTLVFHGVMTVACFLELLYEPEAGSSRRDLTVIAAMTAWAMLGNACYNSESRFYNWFFVVRDPFYLLPESIATFVMPLLNVALFFAVETAEWNFCGLQIQVSARQTSRTECPWSLH